MWFVLVGYKEGWQIMSGPHKEEATAKARLLKDADVDGPKVAIAHVKEVGRIVSTAEWKKV